MPVMPEPTFTIQEWLAARLVPTRNNKPLRYAMWWINRYLGPSHETVRYLDFDGGHLLFVTLGGIRYQVLSVNRFGDMALWDLREPLASGVIRRFMHHEEDFTNWSNTAEGPLDESKFVPYVPISKGVTHGCCPYLNQD